MLKLLIKKQITEFFKGFFYNAKTNKAQSKNKTVFLFVLFTFLMVVVVGGSFFALAFGFSVSLHEAGFDNVYFAIMGLVAVFFGVFGSVFSTYNGLYRAKDNDLLLSMPIPASYIVASRLINVYLFGLAYSGIVFLPAIIAYQVFCGFNVPALIGGVVMLFMISAVDMLLSCLLGFIVAKISLRLKNNKSFITVLISIVLIVGWYILYFRAQTMIPEVIANAALYGQSIESSAPILALWGNCGVGVWLSVLVCFAVSVVVLGAIWAFMSKGFIRLATATGAAGKTEYHEKTADARSVSRSLLEKEFKRFTASANYMLNCGLGILMISVFGVAVLIKGGEVMSAAPGIIVATAPGLVAAILCMLSSMNDMAAPSVSLEGKNLWILQSLPLDPWLVIRAKAEVQFILTLIPMLFCDICVAIAMPFGVFEKVIITLFSVVYSAFASLFVMVLGLKMPNLTWTNEIVPIKQSACVAVAMFGTWGIAIVVGGLAFALAPLVGSAAILTVLTLLTGVFTWLIYRWLRTKGAKIFADL